MLNSQYRWTKRERAILARLNRPDKIQNYLNELRYNSDNLTRSVRGVMATGKAHCFDGALFAAAALEFNGEKPLLVDMRSSKDDDDHVLAVFRRAGLWGAIAKSNYVTCRYRDPVYASVRELVMSYFDGYFNLTGRKTLREYSDPISLKNINEYDWRFTEEDLDPMGDVLESAKHYKLLPPGAERHLAIADDLSFRGATLGLDPKGAHKVKGSRL